MSIHADIESFKKYQRAANYLTAAQIFLQDNFLLERPLSFGDIKPRLLGHWGSGPGITLAYSHLSYLAKKHQQEIMFVLGPGHGFPALQANLFLEDSLKQHYPEATQSYEGISYLCRNFSWPYGFPSHSNPGTPGVILEGGELGYSLSTAYGAALDRPDLMVACLVGDGEAETGPAAAAWHLNKLVDPRTNGAVLPILHLNGYKISAPTIFGRMSDGELMALFTGYGYHPRLVSGDDIHHQMAEALSWAHRTIKSIKTTRDPNLVPRMPMIIMRTLKGWSGVKTLDGLKIEGNYPSHQVVLTEAKTNLEQLNLLENWLRSYKIDEIFNRQSGFGSFVEDVLPSKPLRLGRTPYASGGPGVYKPLVLPKIEDFAEDATVPGTVGSSSMRRVGAYLTKVFELNQHQRNFRLMSPDETYSNKLDEVFRVTKRAWEWPNKPWDKDMADDGRVMEMLSEHNLQGLVQGYVLTGRHAIFASYEAFVQVVVSMMDQYAKFINVARTIPWRKDFASLNYVLTSSGWRQDHNGFSHQNPGFIDDALQRQGDFVTVYFPPDGNSSLVVLETMLKSTKEINILVGGKTLEPRWLTPDQARQALTTGVNTWDFASDKNPDVVLVGVGDYTTKEVLAAIDIVKTEYPAARLRCVNVMSLTSCGLGRGGACLSKAGFEAAFTADKPVIANFHGYPETFKAILFNYTKHPDRFDVRGYVESGSTTTPFDMHVRNRTSRYHLAIAVFEQLAAAKKIPPKQAQQAITKLEQLIAHNTEYIKANGVDVPEIDAWVWPAKRTSKPKGLST